MKAKKQNRYPVLESIIIIFIVGLLIYFMLPRTTPDLQLQVIGTPNTDLSTPSDFNITKYMGVWYELSRYDVSFEKGCACTTARYTLTEDYVNVQNTCSRDGKTSTISGKAYTTDTPGVLMVQFFPTTKSEYRVIFVDRDYQNAIVTNSEMSTLWLLSRTYDENSRAALTQVAKDRGLDTSKLIVVGGCSG